MAEAPRRRGPQGELGPDVGLESARPPLASDGAGAAIVRADLVGTALFVAVALLGAVIGEGPAVVPLIAGSLVMFAVGTAGFLWAYGIAVGRSRRDAIGMGGLYFLSGTAPASVRRRMLGAWAVQLVAALAAASARPFTAVAFAILAPMYGMGLQGLWAARHGAFPPRVVKGRRVDEG